MKEALYPLVVDEIPVILREVFSLTCFCKSALRAACVHTNASEGHDRYSVGDLEV
jgi:hypothetical protein